MAEVTEAAEKGQTSGLGKCLWDKILVRRNNFFQENFPNFPHGASDYSLVHYPQFHLTVQLHSCKVTLQKMTFLTER